MKLRHARKVVSIALLALGAITALYFLSRPASATDTENPANQIIIGGGSRVSMDENGKLVSEPTQYSPPTMQTREQFVAGEEALKAAVAADTAYKEPAPMSDAERAALEAMRLEADRNAAERLKLYTVAFGIVNGHYATQYAPQGMDLLLLDSDIIAKMIDLVNGGDIAAGDRDVLRLCLADQYYGVLPSDPCYAGLRAALGLDSATTDY